MGLLDLFQFASLRASLQLAKGLAGLTDVVSIRVAASVFATLLFADGPACPRFNSRRCERLCNWERSWSSYLSFLVSIRVAASVFATFPTDNRGQATALFQFASLRASLQLNSTYPTEHNSFNSRRCERLCNNYYRSPVGRTLFQFASLRASLQRRKYCRIPNG